jgi:Ca2+-binding RTX toxin-like protein
VVAMQGDDQIHAIGQTLEVDGGSGYDTVFAGLAFRADLQMTLGTENGSVVLRDHGAIRQIYIGVERVEFTNGSYDPATSTFIYSALPPPAPHVGRWWISAAGVLTLSGTAVPGSAVTVQSEGGYAFTAAIAGDGIWTAALPGLGGGSFGSAVTLSATVTQNGLNSASPGFATARIGTTADDDLAAPDGRWSFLSGDAGDDVLRGGPGDDLLLGGEGTDTAVLAAARSQVRLGISGDIAILRGPDGTDTLLGVEQMQFGDTGVLLLADLLADAEPLMGISRNGVPGFLLPDPYIGPVAGLQTQALGSDDGEVIGGTPGNDFVNLFGGSDAANGFAGNDVLDGGLGSNFLTGGSGTDVFFIDGRSGGTTWSTITDWEPGEQLSLWGWVVGTSTLSWTDMDGAPGWQGATMRADLDGNGAAEVTVTWTSQTQAALPTPQKLDGLLWFV